MNTLRGWLSFSRKIFTSRSSKLSSLITRDHRRNFWPPNKKKDYTTDSGWGAWLGIPLLLVTLGGTLYLFSQSETSRKEKLYGKSRGDAKIGGNWTLVDHEGHIRSNASWDDKYKLIYFGFTLCPDVCPVELTKLGKAITALDKDLGVDIVQPLFITLDPWRDSVEQLAAYVKQFHPRLVGLTGTPAQVNTVAKIYRCFMDARNKTNQFRDDYIVDHSIWLYLMDNKGKFCAVFPTDTTAQVVVEKVKDHLYFRKVLKEPLSRKIVEFIKLYIPSTE